MRVVAIGVHKSELSLRVVKAQWTDTKSSQALIDQLVNRFASR